MSKLISVYYPEADERDAMTEAVNEEKKFLKTAKAKRSITHGGLLLLLGRLWREYPEIKWAVRRACGLEGGAVVHGAKALPQETKAPRKAPKNAKRGRSGR